MTHFIAELDEKLEIAAVWIKQKSARGPSVFNPRKHVFDANAADDFFGAPQEAIKAWIADARAKSPGNRTR